MGPLIGTPPTALFATDVGRRTGTEVGSLDWAMVGLTASILLVGELASNTTMAAPIAGAAAMVLEADPVAVPLPVALAARTWVLLPVETLCIAIVMDYQP